MEHTPKVSVIMSVYKEKIEWLQEAIESILNQTFRHFEFIIICDNPEYKEGLECIENYQKADNRIKIIKNELNIGLTKSLNKGIDLAIGKYIARMDADDFSYPRRFEKQVEFMEKHPYIVASGTGAYWWREGTRLIRAHRESNSTVLRSLSVFESPIYHPSAIFKREIDGELVKYNESFKYSQDYALWISLMNNYSLSNIDEPLIRYRISNQQISSSHHIEQRQCALRNQDSAFLLIGVSLSQEDNRFFKDLTRGTGIIFSKKEMEIFINHIMMIIKEKKDLDYSSIARYFLVIFANNIYKNNSFVVSLISLARLCFNIRCFSLYSVLALVSKYLRRSVN